MSTLTKEWLLKTIAELEEERDSVPGAVNEDALMALAAMKIALASLEAEASGRNPVLAYADSYRDMANQGVESIPVWSVITDLERNIAPLFTAPPVPVVPEEKLDEDGNTTSEFDHGWNACRSAMLQAGNSPVTPDCWIPVSERMSERDVDVQVYCADKKEQMVGYMERNEAEGWFRFASLPNGGGVYCKPTHWRPLPAAPQQEGKQ